MVAVLDYTETSAMRYQPHETPYLPVRREFPAKDVDIVRTLYRRHSPHMTSRGRKVLRTLLMER